ncbi:hypothetical protein FBU59_004284 [Linderina macrospora]|uniref:Uncharacterized protein n=1 Tax=Linderina macrospora TaxID=4868 RepID=A0ACC1J603_9FUNG|nr:hypothetical protein FBU59_004284 [Linderina macrospora]
MLHELAAPRKDAAPRAVAALYDALASTYAVHRLPAGKHKLVMAESPAFVKFADMELTSGDLSVALPAWLCRTTVRLLDVAMPETPEEAGLLRRTDAQTSLAYSRPSVSVPAPSPRVHLARKTSSACESDKKAVKQKSFQRLRTKLHADAAEPNSPPSPPMKPRWVASLLGSRRRKT